MGRLNKKLQSKERKKLVNSGISKSAVLATLAKKDQKKEAAAANEQAEEKDEDRYSAINFKKPKPLPETLEELDESPDFQLLLDVPTFMDKAAKANKNPGTFNNKVKKKDKMKIKKDLLRKKLHVCELLKKEEKSAKARKKTVVVGDMKPLADTLNVIDKDIQEEEEAKKEKVLKEGKVSKKKGGGNKGTQKQRKVKETFMQNLSVFNQVNAHPDYRSNPFKTISTHIENKMILESMQKQQQSEK